MIEDADIAAFARDLAHRPGFLIRRLHQIHLALFAEECAAFQVTPVQFSILSVASLRPDLDQVRLAIEIGVDRATLANVLARLEKRGLVIRRASPVDGRMKLVSLSSEGEALLRQMAPAAERAHARTLLGLTARERAAFIQSLRQLVDAGNDYGRAPLRLE